MVKEEMKELLSLTITHSEQREVKIQKRKDKVSSGFKL